MVGKKLISVISSALFVFIGNTALAACPSADYSGDCFVDYEDFGELANHWLIGYDFNNVAEMAIQWLTTDPCIPEDMVYIPDGEFEMGDHFSPEGWEDELPIHTVYVDSFYMGKYEITNQQYCDFLNDANSLGQIKVDGGIVYASSDSSNSYPYCDTNITGSWTHIDYSGGIFSVKDKSGRDMSDDPMVEISWYGAVAYCNWRSTQEGYEQCYNLSAWECDFSKKGYRLPTEAEWEYAALSGQHNPYCRFPWSDPNISHSRANYYAYPGSYSYDENPTYGYHPDWDDDIYPYTAPVGSFAPNGYGMYDMAGNAWEWCNDWYDENYYDVSPYYNPTGPTSGSYRVLRGASWDDFADNCRVTYRTFDQPDGQYTGAGGGFRIVLDLN